MTEASSPARGAARPGRSRRLLATLVVGVPVVVLLVWPQALGVQRAPLIAQALAFRALLGIGLGVLAIAFAVWAIVRRRWAIAAGIAMVLGIASAGNAGVLLLRGSDGAAADGELTVVAWNTQGGAASPQSIARLVLETGADIVSLPETDERAAEEVVRLVALQGMEMTTATTRGEHGDSWIPTSVLIAAHLGEYRVDAGAGSTPGLPSAVWRPVHGSGPMIVAAHPEPPLPAGMDRWRDGLSWIADQCEASDVIVAGDLNATVDHLAGLGAAGDGLVGDCRDAAVESGVAATGTWPATAPTWLASPIDHVLVGSAWTVRRAEVITSFDDAGSDHRPILAQLAPQKP